MHTIEHSVEEHASWLNCLLLKVEYRANARQKDWPSEGTEKSQVWVLRLRLLVLFWTRPRDLNGPISDPSKVQQWHINSQPANRHNASQRSSHWALRARQSSRWGPSTTSPMILWSNGHP